MGSSAPILVSDSINLSIAGAVVQRHGYRYTGRHHLRVCVRHQDCMLGCVLQHVMLNVLVRSSLSMHGSLHIHVHICLLWPVFGVQELYTKIASRIHRWRSFRTALCTQLLS